MRKLYVIASFIALFSASCEEKEVIIPDFELPSGDKKVLIEELTGVSCPNCPAGATKVEAILELFEGKVVAMGIHGELQAEPVDGKSKYDFRNEDAANLEEYLKPFLGKPSLAVNRVKFEDQNFIPIVGVDVWQGYIEAEFEKENVINLYVDHSYNNDTRQVNIDVTATALQDIDGNFSLSVALTESHIIDTQQNQSEIIQEYEHNHVLRDMLTNYQGDNIANGTLSKGQELSKSYSYTLPESDGTWIAENMEIVVFVSNSLDTSKDVLQAEQVHLVE